jgi:hypothetical protein
MPALTPANTEGGSAPTNFPPMANAGSNAAPIETTK